MDFLISAIPTIISTATLGLVAYLSKRFKEFMGEHKLLMEDARNDDKSHIVAIYERAKARGYIAPTELESMGRMYDSYKKLGGNSYICALMHDANNNLPIVGTPIPEIVAAMDAAGKE